MAAGRLKRSVVALAMAAFVAAMVLCDMRLTALSLTKPAQKVLRLYHHPLPNRAAASHASQIRATTRPDRLIVMQDHEDVIENWLDVAGASILHVDKHDDLELPEPSFACRPGGQGQGPLAGIRNNNFLLAAAFCSIASRLLWVHPDFRCDHCSYHSSSAAGTHRCEIGRTGNDGGAGKGEFVVRPLNRSSIQRGDVRACGASRPEWASPTARLVHTAPFELAVTPISLFSAGLTAEAAAGRGGWFLRPWILDFDLDYLVDDSQAPKMRGPPDIEFDHDAPRRHFDQDELERLRKWLAVRRIGFPRNIAAYDVRIGEPPQPIASQLLQERLYVLEGALRPLRANPPLRVCIVRSNWGGYTPIEQTAQLEAAAVGMLRRVFPSLQGVATEYRGRGTLNWSETEQLGRMLHAARRTKDKDGRLRPAHQGRTGGRGVLGRGLGGAEREH